MYHPPENRLSACWGERRKEVEEERQMMVCSSQTRWHCERLWEALGKTSAVSSAGVTVTLPKGEAAWSVGSTLQSQASLLCREVTGELVQLEQLIPIYWGISKITCFCRQLQSLSVPRCSPGRVLLKQHLHIIKNQ